MKKHIIFFRQGIFSNINGRVADWLREQFPEQNLIEIDILHDVIKPARTVVLRAAAIAIWAGRFHQVFPALATAD